MLTNILIIFIEQNICLKTLQSLNYRREIGSIYCKMFNGISIIKNSIKLKIFHSSRIYFYYMLKYFV